MSCTFELPTIQDNATGWGPLKHFPIPTLLGGLEHVPLESSTKSARLGRVCDFTAGKGAGREGRWGPRYGGADGDADFTLVDTKPPPRPPGKGKGGKRGGKVAPATYRAVWGNANDDEAKINPKTGKAYASGQAPTNHAQQLKGSWPGKGNKGNMTYGKGKGFGKGFGKGKGKGKGKGGKQLFRDWSVAVDPEWPVAEEVSLPTLHKLTLGKDATGKKEIEFEPEHISWAGAVPTYDKAYDRVNPKLDKALTKGDATFFNVTARDDPTFQELMMAEECTDDVAVTDHCLAALMAAPRSQYSWDLVLTRMGDKLIIDKRDDSQIDVLTVNETGAEPPQNDDKDAINAPQKLGAEAGAINQNFLQQVCNAAVPKADFENPHPFADEDTKKPVGAYRYQRFKIPAGKIGDGTEVRSYSILVRSEVDCVMPGGGDPVYATVQALNEYDPKKTNQGWRQSLQTQPGAVLATELKQNSAKIARWTCRALISGAELMKFGYVTRTLVTDANRHRILSVQTYKTKDFAQQMGLTKSNAWAIIRSLVHSVMQHPEGKYLLLKDPTKAVMRLYEVPYELFEEEEEEEWDGEEKEKDDEEIGNVPRM